MQAPDYLDAMPRGSERERTATARAEQRQQIRPQGTYRAGTAATATDAGGLGGTVAYTDPAEGHLVARTYRLNSVPRSWVGPKTVVWPSPSWQWAPSNSMRIPLRPRHEKGPVGWGCPLCGTRPKTPNGRGAAADRAAARSGRPIKGERSNAGPWRYVAALDVAIACAVDVPGGPWA